MKYLQDKYKKKYAETITENYKALREIKLTE